MPPKIYDPNNAYRNTGTGGYAPNPVSTSTRNYTDTSTNVDNVNTKETTNRWSNRFKKNEEKKDIKTFGEWAESFNAEPSPFYQPTPEPEPDIPEQAPEVKEEKPVVQPTPTTEVEEVQPVVTTEEKETKPDEVVVPTPAPASDSVDTSFTRTVQGGSNKEDETEFYTGNPVADEEQNARPNAGNMTAPPHYPQTPASQLESQWFPPQTPTAPVPPAPREFRNLTDSPYLIVSEPAYPSANHRAYNIPGPVHFKNPVAEANYMDPRAVQNAFYHNILNNTAYVGDVAGDVLKPGVDAVGSIAKDVADDIPTSYAINAINPVNVALQTAKPSLQTAGSLVGNLASRVGDYFEGVGQRQRDAQAMAERVYNGEDPVSARQAVIEQNNQRLTPYLNTGYQAPQAFDTSDYVRNPVRQTPYLNTGYQAPQAFDTRLPIATQRAIADEQAQAINAPRIESYLRQVNFAEQLANMANENRANAFVDGTYGNRTVEDFLNNPLADNNFVPDVLNGQPENLTSQRYSDQSLISDEFTPYSFERRFYDSMPEGMPEYYKVEQAKYLASLANDAYNRDDLTKQQADEYVRHLFDNPGEYSYSQMASGTAPEQYSIPTISPTGEFNNVLTEILNDGNGVRELQHTKDGYIIGDDGNFILDKDGNKISAYDEDGNLIVTSKWDPMTILNLFGNTGGGEEGYAPIPKGDGAGYRGINVTDEFRKILASSQYTASGQEENAEIIKMTKEEFEELSEKFMEANPVLRLLVQQGKLTPADIADFFFKKIEFTNGSKGGYGGGGYGYRGYGGGRGGYYYGGGGRSNYAPTPQSTNQRQNRIYNIMKNWSF